MDVHTVLELFRDEVSRLGGQVADVVADDERLFARSLLPDSLPVFPDDFVKPGIALRYVSDTVEVRPYVHRVICSNGQILAYSGRGGSVEIVAPKFQLPAIRSLIHEVAASEAFGECVKKMQEARGLLPDPEILLFDLTRRAGFDDAAVLSILERLQEEGEFSLYALGNAVTALARDTRDPVKRWERECAGAEIFARLLRAEPARESHESRPVQVEAG